ncbi:MAG: autotransporter-associated beta strand repeat-containing protein [Verrucomicrobia bacterium]|nr:autotransporter-associated beta strand repeat-containing protein [Verrucomicrobiota bacterium]
MKNRIQSRSLLAITLAVLALAPSLASAANGTWTGADGATWDTSATNWSGVSGTPWAYGNTNNATFTSAGSATISGPVYATSVNYTAGSGTFTVNGNGLNYGYESTVSSGGTLELTGNNSSGGGITLFGGGTLKLSGNNQSGSDLYLVSGILELASNGALSGNDVMYQGDFGSASAIKLSGGSTISVGGSLRLGGTGPTGDGALFVNDGTSNTWNGNVSLFGDSTIGVGSNGGNLTVQGVISGANNLTVKAQGGGTVSLTNDNTYTGTTTVSAGKLVIGWGGPFGSLGSGDVSLSAGTTLEFNRSDTSNVANTITGDGGLTKSGNGILSVSGNNTYTGTTTVSAGTLQIGNGGATGSLGSGNISVDNSATLAFNLSGNATVANTITAGYGGFKMMGGNTLTLTGNNSYAYNSYVNNGSTLVMTGNVNFGGGITLDGGGTLKLSGNNTNNTDMYLVSGILELASSGAVNGGDTIHQGEYGSASAIKLSGGSTISMGGAFHMAGTGPTGDGALFVNDGTTNTWGGSVLLYDNSTIGVGSGGGNLTMSGVISGINNLTVKAQAGGTVSLTNANTYTGSTTVTAGTLLVNGNQSAATGAVSVAAGAILGGNGTIGGDLNLANGALFAFDTAYTLTLNGNLTLNNSFGVASLRNLSGGALDWSSVTDGTYTLLNTSFVFNAGNISNFGLANAYDIGGGRSAYFANGSLNLTVIPEPSTWAMAAVGLATLTIFRRRRQS